MNTPYHRKPIEVAFVSPSTNLFGKSQNCLRNRLGLRAQLVPFDDIDDATETIQDSIVPYELVALDSAALKSHDKLPHFFTNRGEPLPVLMLLRKGETELAEKAMEVGYKALLFIDSDTQYRQLFPGMILRMVAYYRGERQRRLLDYRDEELPETRSVAEDLGVADHVLSAHR